MGVKIKRKRLFEADEQQTQDNGAFNGTDIINKISALQVDTITAAMGIYSEIAEKLKVLINKVVEVAKAQQPAQTGQQQQAQPAQSEQQAQTAQQPAQPAQQAESVRFNTFGSTLNEKIRTANFNKMMNSIVL